MKWEEEKEAMTFRRAVISGEGGDVTRRDSVGEGLRFVRVLVLKLGAGYVSVHSFHYTYNYIRSFVCMTYFTVKTVLKIKKSNEYILKQNAYFTRPFKMQQRYRE